MGERPVDSRKLTTEHFTEKKKDETESEADSKKEAEEQQELEAQNRQGDQPEKYSLSGVAGNSFSFIIRI